MTQHPTLTDEEAAVMKVIEDETVAYFNKDFEGYARCWVHAPYTRRLGWWSGGGVIDRIGWDEIAARARLAMQDQPRPNPSATEIRRENLDIHVGQDMAWVTFHQYGPETGEPDFDMPGLSHETRVLEKHDGEWRIAYHGYIHPIVERVQSVMLRVDGSGNLIWMNKAAEALTRNADHLIVRHGQLRAVAVAANKRLHKAISVAAQVDIKLDGGRTAIPVVLDSVSGEEAIVSWVMSEGSGTNTVMVSVNDLQFTQDRLTAAAAVFELSDTQRRLTECILAGNDLQQSAQYLGISINTVRTHLQRIFDKTGTRSQPALVRTLLSVTAPVD
jgi:DNA-binding CsgD family transcriptional regulator